MSFIHRFLTPLQTLMTLGMILLVAAIAGSALFFAISFWLWVAGMIPWGGPLRVWLLSVTAIGAYFIYGFSLILIVPLARWLTLSFGSPRGDYPYASIKGYQWASYNMLTLIIRYSFINWIRVTPFIVLFHRLMGMKIGKRVLINTAVVSDQNLISIGDDTVIGGDVTLIAHAVEGKQIRTAPVTIGDHVTVGLMAVIMPGCQIGDRAIIAANAVLKKGTIVGESEIWGGVPAVCIGRRDKILKDSQVHEFTP